MFGKSSRRREGGIEANDFFQKNGAEVYKGEDSWKLEFTYCLETRIYLQSEDFTMNFTPSIDV